MGQRINEAKARRIEWTAHNEPWLWPVMGVLAAGSPLWSKHGGPAWPWGVVAAAWLGGYLVGTRKAHHDLACARCWRRTPPQSMAAGEVARYRRLLWFAHAAMSMRVLWLFVPCLAAMFVPVQAVSVGGLVGLVATGSGLAVAMTKHKQLARWCPRCPRHGGGGGGGTYALPPLPVTTGSKVRR